MYMYTHTMHKLHICTQFMRDEGAHLPLLKRVALTSLYEFSYTPPAKHNQSAKHSSQMNYYHSEPFLVSRKHKLVTGV